MATILNDVTDVLHKIRVKLYPNYLEHKIPGKYLARTDSEATVTIEQICMSAKNRGGYTGDLDDMIKHVHRFLHEAVYLLCDGFALNLLYFLIYPKVGGTFDKKTEGVSEETHPVTFHFRTLKALRDIGKFIQVLVEGVADTAGYIDELIDISTGAVNETVTPGKNFSINGHKMKIEGDAKDAGVFFVAPGSPVISVKATENLAVNEPSRIVGIVPALPAGKTWRVEIRTVYSGGSRPLKELRVIKSEFTLTTS